MNIKRLISKSEDKYYKETDIDEEYKDSAFSPNQTEDENNENDYLIERETLIKKQTILMNQYKNIKYYICVELKNNNQIFVKSNKEMTIKDLIIKAIQHPQFRKLYGYKSSFVFNPTFLLSHYDLELICFQNIGEIRKRRVDKSFYIKDLFEYRLINEKYPIFGLIDNKNTSNTYILNQLNTIIENSQTDLKGNQVDIDDITNQVRMIYEIVKNKEIFYGYNRYLPRNNSNYFLIHNQEFTSFYENSKLSINFIKRIETNRLINDNDWLIYNDETIGFLINIEKEKIDIQEIIKIDSQNELYPQDKLPELLLSNKEYKSFRVEVKVNENLAFTLLCKLTTTAKEILNMVNKKLGNLQKGLFIDEEKKILKVKSLSDYIFEYDIPIGMFTYVYRCLKNRSLIVYEIIDNPFLEMSQSSEKMTDKVNEEKRKSNLFTTTIKYNNSSRESNKKNSIYISYYINEYIYERTEKYRKSVENMRKNNLLFKIIDEAYDNQYRKLLINVNRLKELKVMKEGKGKELNDLINKFNDEKLLGFNYDLYNNNKNNYKCNEDENQNINEDIPQFRKRGKVIKSQNLIQNQNQNQNQSQSKLILTSYENEDYYQKLFKNTISEVDDSIGMSTRIKKYYSSLIYSPINIESLKLPFSISIREFKLSDDAFSRLVTNNDSQENRFLISIYLTVGIKHISKKNLISHNDFSLNNTNSNPNSISTHSINCANSSIVINKKIIFKDILFCQLPVYSSVIIKIYNIDIANSTKKVIGWTNYKIFDHRYFLNTGIKCIGLNTSDFNDTSYFKWDAKFKEIDPLLLYIELPTFNNKVKRFKQKFNDSYKINLNNLIIQEKDKEIINKIKNISPFFRLSETESGVLWNNRYAITNIPELIPRLIQCVDFKNSNHLDEINVILYHSKFMNPEASLQLFTGEYLHDEIRNYAVRCISQAPNQYFSDYLSQLIQALKNEQNHDSELARYLLKSAVKYPTTIGHSFFWGLKSEMHLPEVQQRFGILLEAFLSKVGDRFIKGLSDEIWLVDELLKIADIPFSLKYKKNKELIMTAFKEALDELSRKFEGRSIPIPINYNIRVVKIISEKCKIMKSKKRPLWLAFETSNREIINIMFKKGDDLRQDILTLQLFKTMQNIWFDNGLRLKMSIYSVVSTGYFQGMLEIVMNSITLAAVHKEYGGVTAAFSKFNLQKWFQKESLGENEYINNFKYSCVAYCISTFVLGIGDRHNDNLMVKTNGELFHIDFGHFLGHFKYKLGIKRERAPFVFTREFKQVLGGKKSDDYKEFRTLCLEAYKILRKNSNILISLLRLMICCDIPELSEVSIKFLEGSLYLNGKDEKVEAYLEDQFENAIKSLFTKINFAIHILANK